MSKEEFLKIQTCVLKVNIHCDGCKQKVKKILQKIDGVYTTKIDSEQGKVTVSGNVDPATLIKKLTKNGKHAELWGGAPQAPKAGGNQAQIQNQLKNLHIDGGINKGQVPPQKGGGGNNQPKGGGGQIQNPQLQQLQQLQQLKGFQDLKLPPQFMKDMKMPLPQPINKEQNQKSVKFNLPEDEGLSDDELDEFDDDSEFDDDYDDDDDEDVDDVPQNHKMMKPVVGNGHGGAHMPNLMANSMKNVGGGGGGGGGNGKKGGGGNIPVQINLDGNDGKGGANTGKKGGNGNNNGGNQNHGGRGGNNGGGPPPDIKNIGGSSKNGGGGVGGGLPNGVNLTNGVNKGGGMNDGPPRSMPNMMALGAGAGAGAGAGGGYMNHPNGKNMPMAQMGNLPTGHMSNFAAVPGLPASAGGGGGGAGYFPSSSHENMAGNPYYQQQLAAMMMNQQRANGNERFHPMMYAPPPPAVNYMPPAAPYHHPYPYPPPPPSERTDQYAMFSDENTSSCTLM